MTYKAGDRVFFAKRTQISTHGMVIAEVNTNMFDTLIRLNEMQGWWVPECFVPYSKDFFNRGS